MSRTYFTILFQFFLISVHAQVYQGLIVPDNLGRFDTASEIKQASGLALDPNNISLWTHNDQGNPQTKVYKFQTTSGNQNVILQKQVSINNVTNLDWEDLAKDNEGNIYLCQIGKNCNDNSDPVECPNRFIFKIHKLNLSSLNHADSTTVTPITYYFKYPITGYDMDNCDPGDTVFVNSEAAIWYENALYLFTKNIWSKPTNNCGGWQTGYTYYFKLDLTPGSSMQNPLVAMYKGKVNLRMFPTETAAYYQVTGAALSPDESILALLTYGRIWQFRNQEDDEFFNLPGSYANFSVNGVDSITRGYEGVEFINNEYIKLCVDGINGRLSGIHLDTIALQVRNHNDKGPGSLRNVLLSAGAGDTIKFKSNIHQDTIELTSGPLVFHQPLNVIQPTNQPIKIQSQNSDVIQILSGIEVRLKNIHIISHNATDGVVNQGLLRFEGNSKVLLE